jgi:hypothetical protein
MAERRSRAPALAEERIDPPREQADRSPRRREDAEPVFGCSLSPRADAARRFSREAVSKAQAETGQ